MWSKVATNAVVLKGHLVTLANEIKRKNSFFFKVETIKVLQTTAVFHEWTGTKKILLKFQAPVSNPLHPLMYR
jgi:predicted ATP-dependent serine protease